MLGVIEREVTRKVYFWMRPVKNWSRGRVFAKTESAGTDLTGSWDESMLRRNDLGGYQDTQKVHTFIDNEQSKGSHIVDVDGNVLLDLCSTETLPLGHNNEAFVKDIVSNKQFDAFIINGNLDAAERADDAFVTRAGDALDAVAPQGLSAVTLTGPNNAVESAIFAAMRERGADARMSALGFEGSHHGNSLALAQFAHPNMSLQLGWPSVKYPENAGQESQILDSIRSAISKKRDESSPVAAIVIEPTNAQSGYTASSNFMNELARIARDSQAALIVDEQSTCCGATGAGFWQYQGPADYVVFGKRMQVSGYFSSQRDGSRDVNLAGSQLGINQFKVIKDHMDNRKLIEEVDRAGKSIGANVARACEKSSRITGTRTVGTCSWIDTADSKSTMELYTHLRENGVLVKLNGARGVMTKPALTWNESQASPLTSALQKF